MTMGATTATDLDQRLYRQLQLVNDWLKFAEAKNMGMLDRKCACALGSHPGCVTTSKA